MLKSRLLKALISTIFLLAIIWWVFSCHKNSDPGPSFSKTPVLHAVATGFIDEASGLADSYSHQGYLWVNEDSGQSPELHLLSHSGKLGKKVFIKNITNRDWEEIAVSNGPVAGRKYLYIGDTGDNLHRHSTYAVYRLPEPAVGADTIDQFDKIQFTYPDGPHDAEAFFVEPVSKDIYLITKRDIPSKIYRLPYPQSVSGMNTAEYVADLPFNGVVAAAYSETKRELLIKTYGNIYYYKHSNGQSIADLVKKPYVLIPYQVEPQGEAICFANDDAGFFTLSEKGFAPFMNLNFYKRK